MHLPDMFSVVRDDLFDTGGDCRSPAIPCPKCGTVLTRGKTTIDFEYAPSSTRHQIVDGWVCPCGESYVPGSQARAAYLRAFVTGFDE